MIGVYYARRDMNCLAFTRELAATYIELCNSGKMIEIVFVSADADLQACCECPELAPNPNAKPNPNPNPNRQPALMQQQCHGSRCRLRIDDAQI